MALLSTLGWVFKCVFTCNHGRTAPKEGKCYCPDCGRGVIFQWVVMRCEECNIRTDSHTALRQLVPDQRCCSNCGERAFCYQYLEAPSYFQLHKARLMIREEADYLQNRYNWSVYAFGETLGKSVGQKFEQVMQGTQAWLTTKPRYAPVLIAMQSQSPKS